uniref:RRM domain-containing protein n=1 Tax=Rhodosorus marinus TaxID=101924 RepID=A0A7S3AAQ8_9RHOD|mmetsp:Transcript_9483/g.41001  ORF Transcript_9483/g.41001 Transcript_9483/m.41001 type:complete len:253 (+) Transcript_9483:287-1045(+)|eukprot:CAMPEP_0113966110 /NCGR_PEP_ID=MMETSP0011_2-20120614/8140_1 /TAXON_ID=101924 /ORGANISM="Rhodosorus marinus" /LENGTH=252 /DNA_ID=CAMNT_0000978741 /DNA_START=148 /DNA_END=906 /DNA_ORIENTATION=+ /assembly_acc=CAM_ASM_000156
MAFVSTLNLFLRREGAISVCDFGRRSLPNKRTQVRAEQLVSKPMRPNSPAPDSSSSELIEDYAGLTDIRPEPVLENPAEEVDVPDGDPDVVYYSQCSKCKAVYELRPKVLGLDGSKVQCSVCKNQWYQRRDKLMELDPAVDELEDFPESERERFKRSSPSRGGYNGGGRPSGQFYTAFVGNLSFNTTREELYDLVKDRDVVRCHVVEKDGRSKGFAFIDFRTKEQLNKAMDELDGYELGGRQIIFKEGRNSS